jgi:predicted transcriptional regulator
MAMTLRLSDDETAALRAQAEREHRSMHEIARTAINEYVSGHSKREVIDKVLESELVRYADALERLGR